MTREEAIKIIEQRVAVDRQDILNGGEPVSDFDKFITEQDEALEMALEAMKNPVGYLTGAELVQAYEKQQHIYDRSDIENELDMGIDYYIDEFGIDKEPVTEDEIERMANNLRYLLNSDADATWSSCCSQAAAYVLSCRNEEKEKKSDE